MSQRGSAFHSSSHRTSQSPAAQPATVPTRVIAPNAATFGAPLKYSGNNSPSRLPRHQNQGAATPQPPQHAIPSTVSPAGPSPPPSGSPTTSYRPLAAARRILTSKSPQATSLSRLRSLEAERLSNMHLGLPGVVSRLAHDASPLSAPPTMEESPQLLGLMPGQGAAPPPSRPTSRLSRSLSQPMMRHGDQPPVGGLVQELGRRLLYSPVPPLAMPVPQSRSMMGETLRAAGVVGQLPPIGSALQLGDGQQHLLAITPTHGETILIPVDYHQASKQADEKRQRNAGASARFRQRKKEREKEQQQGLQKLETQNRKLEKKIKELERRNQELEAECDFYRGERNHLRDIVSRTPGDRGPPSPTPSRSAGSYLANNSPLPAPAPTPLPHPHPSAHSHALAHPHLSPASYGDPSMLERPEKRRRTDPEPGLGTMSYRPTISLPPLAGGPPPPYTIPQPPHLAAASPETARIPPSRFDHPYPTSETSPPLQPGPPPPPAPPQIGQPSAYYSFTEAPYEWATGPLPTSTPSPSYEYRHSPGGWLEGRDLTRGQDYQREILVRVPSNIERENRGPPNPTPSSSAGPFAADVNHPTLPLPSLHSRFPGAPFTGSLSAANAGAFTPTIMLPPLWLPESAAGSDHRSTQNSVGASFTANAGHRTAIIQLKDARAVNGNDLESPTTTVKKRRKQVVQPGRCHTCHTTNTPMWRRGLDGPGSLCNACGLVYANSQRKAARDRAGGAAGSLNNFSLPHQDKGAASQKLLALPPPPPPPLPASVTKATKSHLSAANHSEIVKLED